jgi:hypothetical protein
MQTPMDNLTFSINIITALILKYAMIPSFHQQMPNSEFIKRKTSNIQHHKKKQANIQSSMPYSFKSNSIIILLREI